MRTKSLIVFDDYSLTFFHAMSNIARLGFLALLASFWLPSTAEAFGSSYWRPSNAGVYRTRGTSMTGVVQSVDHSTRWITFVQDGGPVRQFVYSSRARFWYAETEVRPAHLLPGMRIHVYLRIPFFGPDNVNQIGLLDPPQQKRRRSPMKAPLHD